MSTYPPNNRDRARKLDAVKAALRAQGYRTRKSPYGSTLYRIYRDRAYLCSMFWEGQSWHLSDAEAEADRTKILALVQEAQNTIVQAEVAS